MDIKKSNIVMLTLFAMLVFISLNSLQHESGIPPTTLIAVHSGSGGHFHGGGSHFRGGFFSAPYSYYYYYGASYRTGYGNQYYYSSGPSGSGGNSSLVDPAELDYYNGGSGLSFYSDWDSK